ncbi:MAG: sigma-70 family RNA polymerase sigma factor [Pirellulales bacterium]
MDPRIVEATRLWVRAQPVVTAFLSTVVRDFCERDDLLQDVAVAVMQGFDRYDRTRPFTPWAIGVARNQVGLYLRRRKRDRHTFDSEAMERVAAAFERLSPEATSQFDRLGECLAAVTGRARQICDLRYRDDLKPAAIASRLGMQPNAVSKALQRVRDQLRQCIEAAAASKPA